MVHRIVQEKLIDVGNAPTPELAGDDREPHRGDARDHSARTRSACGAPEGTRRPQRFARP